MDFFDFGELNIPSWIYSLYWSIYFVAFTFCLYFLLLKKISSKAYVLTVLFIVFFILYSIFYCVNTDYFGYRDWLTRRDYSFWSKETFYVVLINFIYLLDVKYPYEVFRFVIWGGAILITFFSSKRCKDISPLCCLMFLFLIYSGNFCYARASLGIAVFFAGLSSLSIADSLVNKIITMTIMFSSVLFHKEMVILIAIFPLIFTHIEKKESMLFSLVLITVFSLVLTYIMNNLDLIDFSLEGDSYADKLGKYNDDISSGRWGQLRISHFVEYAVYIYPLFFLTKLIWKYKVSITVLYLYRIYLGILMLSIVFMLVFGIRNVFVYRTLYMGMVPISMLLSYFYTRRLLPKTFLLKMLLLSLILTSTKFMFHV